MAGEKLRTNASGAAGMLLIGVLVLISVSAVLVSLSHGVAAESAPELIFLIGEPESNPKLMEVGIHVYGLTVVNDDTIQGQIKNTGNAEGQVWFTLSVNDVVIKSGSFMLRPGEIRTVTQKHLFKRGSNEIVLAARIKAGSDYAYSSDILVFFVTEGEDEYGWLDEYRCSGNYKQRLYRYYDGDEAWYDWEFCKYGCYSGLCRSAPGPGEWRCFDSTHRGWYEDGKWSYVDYCPNGCESGSCIPRHDERCDVDIRDFNYVASIFRDHDARVSVVVENTGEMAETITLKLYMDSTLEESITRTVSIGGIISKTFYLYPSWAGTHSIKLIATASCGASDAIHGSIRVVQEQAGGPSPQPPVPPAPEPSYVTGAQAYPESIDMRQYDARAITIDITSRIDQTFKIRVSGVDPEWLSYEREVRVNKGTSKIYVYVTPGETGSYALTLSVTAKAEDREFRDSVSLYVTKQSPATSFDSGPGLEGLIGGTGGDAIGPWVLLTAVLIIFTAVVVVGFFKLKEERILRDFETTAERKRRHD